MSAKAPYLFSSINYHLFNIINYQLASPPYSTTLFFVFSSGAEGTKSLRKNMRRKVNDSDFKYPCEWIGCNYVLANMSEFNNHVSQHRREYTKCLGSDEKIGSGKYPSML